MDERGLGRRLQQARQAAGLTQQMLCQKANLSYSTLAKIERGAIKSPSIFTIQSIAAALDTTLDVLLGTPSQAVKPKRYSKSGVSFVYFDVNGCLVHFFHKAFTQLAHESSVPADIIETTYWHYNDMVTRGEMSVDDFDKVLAKTMSVPSVDWKEHYISAIEPIPGIEDLLKWASEHYQVGLLTNIMPGFLDVLRERHLIPDISYDVIIDSSKVGCIKPEKKIYEIAQEQAHCESKEILLVDDTRANLMAAEALGWHVSWFSDYESYESIERVRLALEPAEEKTETATTEPQSAPAPAQ